LTDGLVCCRFTREFVNKELKAIRKPAHATPVACAMLIPVSAECVFQCIPALG